MSKVPIPKEKWSGAIGTLEIGDRTIGGGRGMPLLSFEQGTMNRPLVAGEVLDTLTDYPELAARQFGEGIGTPAAWARRWVEIGADAICLRLLSTDPEGEGRPPEEAADLVASVLEAVDVPVIVYGSGNAESDAKVLEAVSAKAGRRVVLGHAEEESYRTVAATSMASDNPLIAFSNLDINLAKQMNILLTDFGMDLGTVIMDPLMAALGMGLEYSYSVNERIRLAALSGDRMLQVPMVCDAVPSWQVREASEDAPGLGDPSERVAWWEATTALAALLSGADVVIIRGARAAEIVIGAIDDLTGAV